MQCDNEAAIHGVIILVFHERTKYIDIQLEGLHLPLHVSSAIQVANLFATKTHLNIESSLSV